MSTPNKSSFPLETLSCPVPGALGWASLQIPSSRPAPGQFQAGHPQGDSAALISITNIIIISHSSQVLSNPTAKRASEANAQLRTARKKMVIGSPILSMSPCQCPICLQEESMLQGSSPCPALERAKTRQKTSAWAEHPAGHAVRVTVTRQCPRRWPWQLQETQRCLGN